MKERINLLEEQFRIKHIRYSEDGSEKILKHAEFFLFITDSHDHTLKGINLRARNYFSEISGELHQTDKSFFERIIHPEDYREFIDHLETIRDLSEGEEKEFVARIKSTEEKWTRYIFKHRRYLGKGRESRGEILGIAREYENRKIIKIRSTGDATEGMGLRNSIDRYQTILDALDEGFCILELVFSPDEKAFDYLFLQTNPAFEKQVGLQKAKGGLMREFNQNLETHWLETFADVALTGNPIRFQNFTGQDHKTWFDSYAFPIANKGCRQVAVLFSNITEQKKLQEQIRKANETLEEKVKERTREADENSRLLQAVFDSTKEGIVILQPVFDNGAGIVDFRFIRTNKVISDRYRLRELIGRSFLEVDPQALEKGVFDALKSTMLNGRPKDFEYFYEEENYKRWFRITIRRQDDVLIVTLEDITRRKLTSQRLKEHVRFKKQLVKASPDYILIFNLYEEKIEYLNRNLSSRPGMTKRDLLGMPMEKVISLVHPGDREKVVDFHQKLQNSSDKEICEVEFKLKGGDDTWQYYNARGKVFMRSKKGKVYEYLILLRNVQEQKQTQRALLHAEKLSIKGEIARTIAHELRNPLASISMSADILSQKILHKQTGQMDNYVRIIKKSGKTLNNLITAFLTSSSYSPAVLKKCCLAKITSEALKQAEDRIYLTGITVVKKYRGPRYIRADKEKLTTALLNIIVNASEAMTPEDGVLSLAIKESTTGYTLSITDNGRGMENEQIEKLFDSFYTARPGGLGIGLSAVKNILEEHEATVEVNSKPKKGTTFHLSFEKYE